MTRRLRGGPDAGNKAAGHYLDHHTFILNPDGADSVLWLSTRMIPPSDAEAASTPWQLKPGAVPYASSPRAVERPAHPPAFSAVVGGVATLATLIWGDGVSVEKTFAIVNVAFGVLAILATYWAGRAVMPPAGAAAACAILTAASPWLEYGQLIFSEQATGLLLALGLGAVLRRWPVLAGLLVTGAFWIKPPFVCAGFAWTIYLLAIRERAAAIRMTAVCTLGGIALLVFNLWMARTPFVSGAGGFVLASGLRTAYETLFSPWSGLFVYAPWVLPTLVLGAVLLRDATHRPLIMALLLPAMVYYPVVSSCDWVGGYGYGPRYWIPMMPLFAIAATYTVRVRPGRLTLAAMIIAVALGAVVNLTSATCVRSIANLSPHVVLRQAIRSLF